MNTGKESFGGEEVRMKILVVAISILSFACVSGFAGEGPDVKSRALPEKLMYLIHPGKNKTWLAWKEPK